MMYFLIFTFQDVNAVLNAIEEDWKVRDEIKRRVTLEAFQPVKLIIKFLMVSSFMLPAMYLVYRLNAMYLTQPTPVVTNGTIRRAMIASSEFFFEYQTTPRFEFIAIFQFIAATICCQIYLFGDGLFITFIFHLCGQIKHLKLSVTNIVPSSGKSTFASTVKLIVQRYLELTRYNN